MSISFKSKVVGALHKVGITGHNRFEDRFAETYQRALAQRTDQGSSIARTHALAEACQSLLADRWAQTQNQDAGRSAGRRIHYLSMEFLMGRALSNALAALSLRPEFVASL